MSLKDKIETLLRDNKEFDLVGKIEPDWDSLKDATYLIAPASPIEIPFVRLYKSYRPSEILPRLILLKGFYDINQLQGLAQNLIKKITESCISISEEKSFRIDISPEYELELCNVTVDEQIGKKEIEINTRINYFDGSSPKEFKETKEESVYHTIGVTIYPDRTLAEHVLEPNTYVRELSSRTNIQLHFLKEYVSAKDKEEFLRSRSKVLEKCRNNRYLLT